MRKSATDVYETTFFELHSLGAIWRALFAALCSAVVKTDRQTLIPCWLHFLFHNKVYF
jgi:hypothetical protein